ncbi:MAG: hypothetical protein WA996_00015 [Candidatus Promineifilaceae bacterium]
MKEVKIVRFNPSLQADTVKHPVRKNTAEAVETLTNLVNAGWQIKTAGGDNNAFVVLVRES